MKALKFSSFVITATVLFTGFNMLEANAELNRTEAAMVASSNRNVLDLNQGVVGGGSLARSEMSDSFSLANAKGYVKQRRVIRRRPIVIPPRVIRRRPIVIPPRVIRRRPIVTPRGVIHRRPIVIPRRVIRRY